jgi:hypothetical protein
MPDEIIEGAAVEVGELPGQNVPAIYVEPPRGLAIAPGPVEMVGLAAQMATALVDVVEKQHLYAVVGYDKETNKPKKFPNVEAWLTIARMDNVVAREHGLPVRHEDGSYEAVVDLIRLSDGMVVGQGSAICGMADDERWATASSTAKRGMAVTRATSRACRQHYAWIMAMAGYQPTPAEEMAGYGGDSPYDPPTSQSPGHSAPSAPSAPRNVTPAPSGAPGASEGLLQLVVSEQPEGAVRMVKDGHDPLRWEGVREKVEVVGKIGNRKHTAIVLGPLAQAVASAGIVIDMPVRFAGAVVEEITWAEGKPTKKEIWGAPPDYLMTDVQVPDGKGGWTSLAGSMLPLSSDSAPEPSSAAGSSPEPSPGPSATTTSETPSSPTTPSTERKQGDVGTFEALTVRIDKIEYVPRGNVEVVVLHTADLATGELVVAALAVDIEEMIGPKGELQPGDVRSMYGEWKSGGRFVIDTIGKVPA